MLINPLDLAEEEIQRAAKQCLVARLGTYRIERFSDEPRSLPGLAIAFADMSPRSFRYPRAKWPYVRTSTPPSSGGFK